jgi:TIR domain
MSNDEVHPPKVFISYSHDSQEHADLVLELSDHLRADGIDWILDQYEDSPPEGFPRWMDRQIRNADFVLMICTPTYYRRVMGEEEPGKGHGVAWESTLIYQYIYNAGTSNTRFIPILLEGAKESDIPVPWQRIKYNRPYTATGYEELYRRLTNQPLVSKPSLGNLRKLPPRERKNDFIDTEPEIKVLCCYAHKDKRLRDKLEVSLRNSKKQIQITAWNDLEIDLEGRGGYKNEAYLHTADVILLLVSSNFLATDFSYNIEMKLAMERLEAREALVIPLILSPTDWKYTPFASLQALPQDGKPITAWVNLDEAFLNSRLYSDLRYREPRIKAKTKIMQSATDFHHLIPCS